MAMLKNQILSFVATTLICRLRPQGEERDADRIHCENVLARNRTRKDPKKDPQRISKESMRHYIQCSSIFSTACIICNSALSTLELSHLGLWKYVKMGFPVSVDQSSIPILFPSFSNHCQIFVRQEYLMFHHLRGASADCRLVLFVMSGLRTRKNTESSWMDIAKCFVS